MTASRAHRVLQVVVFLMAVGMAVMGWQIKRLSEELRYRPAIAVMDVMGQVEALQKRAPEGSFDDRFRTVRGMAERLAESGYVVLDMNSVLASPREYEVRP